MERWFPIINTPPHHTTLLTKFYLKSIHHHPFHHHPFITKPCPPPLPSPPVKSGTILDSVKASDLSGTFSDKTLSSEVAVEAVAPLPVAFYDGAGPDGRCCPLSSHERCGAFRAKDDDDDDDNDDGSTDGGGSSTDVQACPGKPNNGPCPPGCEVYSKREWILDRPWETPSWKNDIAIENPCSGDSITGGNGKVCPFFSDEKGICPPGCDGNYEMIMFAGDER